MKKFTLLALGIMMMAGGLVVSCSKKSPSPHGKCGPCHMDQPGRRPPPPDCSPCRKY